MTTATAACRIPAGRVDLGSDTLFPDQYPAQSPTGSCFSRTAAVVPGSAA